MLLFDLVLKLTKLIQRAHCAHVPTQRSLTIEPYNTLHGCTTQTVRAREAERSAVDTI